MPRKPKRPTDRLNFSGKAVNNGLDRCPRDQRVHGNPASARISQPRARSAARLASGHGSGRVNIRCRRPMSAEMHDARRDQQSGRRKFKNRRLGNSGGGGALRKTVCAACGMSAWTMAPPIGHQRCVQHCGLHFHLNSIRRQNVRRRHLYLREGRILMAGMSIGRPGSKHDGHEQNQGKHI